MKWDVDFRLHHYGPYSTEIASSLDELASREILIEEEQSNSVGVQYNYRLPESTSLMLEMIEQKPTEVISKQKQEFGEYKEKIDQLLKENLWLLELGSTIAHYYVQVNDWDEAKKQACAFKRVESERKSSLAALKLAKSVIE